MRAYLDDPWLREDEEPAALTVTLGDDEPEEEFVPDPLVVDHDSGSRYFAWTDGYAIGYRVEHQDGTTEFIYLNASGGSDDGTPTVTLYQGPVGDPSQDPAWHHYDLNERTEP